MPPSTVLTTRAWRNSLACSLPRLSSFCSPAQHGWLSRSFVVQQDSIARRLEIAAFQAMDLCTPADATKIVHAVGDSKIFVHVVVALAFVIAVPTG